MNPDPEPLLEQLAPRGADPTLRAQVLAQVGKELEARAGVHWQRRCGWAVAAGVLLAIGLNCWIAERQERRLAHLYGPPPTLATPHEMARTTENRTDVKAAQRTPYSLTRHIQMIDRCFQDLEAVWKENPHEAIQEDPQNHSACPRTGPGALVRLECHQELDHGCAA